MLCGRSCAQMTHEHTWKAFISALSQCICVCVCVLLWPTLWKWGRKRPHNVGKPFCQIAWTPCVSCPLHVKKKHINVFINEMYIYRNAERFLFISYVVVVLQNTVRLGLKPLCHGKPGLWMYIWSQTLLNSSFLYECNSDLSCHISIQTASVCFWKGCWFSVMPFIMCQSCWFTVSSSCCALFVNSQLTHLFPGQIGRVARTPPVDAEWHEWVRKKGPDPAEQCVCGMQSGAAGYRCQHWLLALSRGGRHTASQPEHWHTHVHPLRLVEGLFSSRWVCVFIHMWWAAHFNICILQCFQSSICSKLQNKVVNTFSKTTNTIHCTVTQKEYTVVRSEIRFPV